MGLEARQCENYRCIGIDGTWGPGCEFGRDYLASLSHTIRRLARVPMNGMRDQTSRTSEQKALIYCSIFIEWTGKALDDFAWKLGRIAFTKKF